MASTNGSAQRFRMGRILAALGATLMLILLAPPQTASASAAEIAATVSPINGQEFGAERVVLRTDAGDIVVALYPKVAPRNAEQFLRLARAGLLDTSSFFRIEPGFVAQVDTRQRSATTTPDQLKAMIDVPREMSTKALHKRGVLSMAYVDGKPDGGGTSFSILLGDAPHLDGQYTAFGEVVHGMDVVDTIAAAPLDGNRPRQRIAITSAEIVARATMPTLRGVVALPVVSTSHEAHPRLILPTPNGDVLIALAPKPAPDHVAKLLAAVKANAFDRPTLSRLQENFYVQISSASAAAVTLSGLPTEQTFVGNVRGAVSLYDGGAPGTPPTLIILLTDSPQLNSTYTPVGWVEAGLDNIAKLATRPANADHLPQVPETLGALHAIDATQPMILRTSGQSASNPSSERAALALAAAAACIALLLFVLQSRLTAGQIGTLLLSSVLVGFFAVWVGLSGNSQPQPLVGAALFAAAIGVFKLMGRFERPAPPPAPMAAVQPVSVEQPVS
jgi:peptidyl-prolyl cis-trans isomerase B (cyclophilin B)